MAVLARTASADTRGLNTAVPPISERGTAPRAPVLFFSAHPPSYTGGGEVVTWALLLILFVGANIPRDE